MSFLFTLSGGQRRGSRLCQSEFVNRRRAHLSGARASRLISLSRVARRLTNNM
jgi:hypothetical protein